MTELGQKHCKACTPTSQPVTQAELEQLKPQLPDWKIVEREGISRLEKVYSFPDFQSAIAFTNSIADEAEREGHHPALLTEWGKVTVSWWTHAISGLHINDLIMAAKTDAIRKKMF